MVYLTVSIRKPAQNDTESEATEMASKMRSRTSKRIRRILISLGVGLPTMLGVSTPAGALDLVSIPIDGIVYGAEGETVLVASVRVPEELVGQTCAVVGKTDNQESVHPNNDLLIVNGGETLVVPNFEDEGFIVHEAGDFEEISPLIEVFVRFGPDGVSSGGFRVSVDCDAVPPPPPVTEPESTPTTVPSTSTPPTSVPEPVVDEAPLGPTTSFPPVAQTPAEQPPAGPSVSPTGELPVTGSTTTWIVVTGAALVCAGLVVRRFSASPSRIR